MKAMVLSQPDLAENNPLKLMDLPIPEPKANEIRLRIKACGVCHTDLHEVEGELPLPQLPLIPGHEIVADVDKLGDKVTSFTLGDRVGVPWLYSSCMTCKYCQRGQENLCSEAKFTGYHVNGGYAEYTIVPESFAYHLPKNFSDVQAAPLLCAGVIGYRSIRLSDVKPGETLGLFGFGASAHIVIQIAHYWNCETYVFTRSKEHQEHARRLGAAWVGTSKDEPPKKIDRAILFAPAGSLVLDVLRVLDKGGTLAINAIYLSDIPPITWDLLYHERTVRSVANTTRQDAIEFLELAEKIPVKTDTQSFPLNQANKALQDMKASRINGAGVLVI
ncbi:MAG: zinc-dependent alcohol dehydrogenase family protein [Promethearchaeota archaeon]